MIPKAGCFVMSLALSFPVVEMLLGFVINLSWETVPFRGSEMGQTECVTKYYFFLSISFEMKPG